MPRSVGKPNTAYGIAKEANAKLRSQLIRNNKTPCLISMAFLFLLSRQNEIQNQKFHSCQEVVIQEERLASLGQTSVEFVHAKNPIPKVSENQISRFTGVS
jgi:hypothetical protein